MQRRISNQDCKLYHTAYCDMLNMPSCEVCFLNDKKADPEQTISDLDALAALLPEEGVHHLFTDEHCVFCKGRERGERAYYGLMDLAHAEPKRMKRSVIGLKVRTLAGSLLPVQLSTCKDCRRRFLNLSYLPVLLPLILGIIAMIILMLPGVSDKLEKTAMVLPLLLFAGVMIVGVILSRILVDVLKKRYDQVMYLDPWALPTLRDLQQKGWFSLNKRGKSPRLIFSRQRMRMGAGTGAPEDAVCPDSYIQ